MIIDQIDNFKNYKLGKVWNKAFEFIVNIKPDCEEKKYEIDKDNIYAIVSNYNTKTVDEAKLEAHKKYIDIQFLLSGVEIIQSHNITELLINTDYSDEKDVIFYNKPDVFCNTTILYPGIFAVFFPQDAHMPGLAVDENNFKKVKKVVIKIKTELL